MKQKKKAPRPDPVEAARRADRATGRMRAPSGSCGGRDCPNQPVWGVGNLRICGACLERVRADYPASFAKYWEPKIVRLAEAAAA